MRFCKMNGAGNDFIILNNLEEKLDHSVFPAVARTLCHRHLSIGADGLMVVEAPSQGGDYRMLFYNADGSQGGRWGRCAATGPGASAGTAMSRVWPVRSSGWRPPPVWSSAGA